MLRFIRSALVILVAIGIIALTLWVLFDWLKLNLYISVIIFAVIFVLVLIGTLTIIL